MIYDCKNDNIHDSLSHLTPAAHAKSAIQTEEVVMAQLLDYVILGIEYDQFGELVHAAAGNLDTDTF